MLWGASKAHMALKRSDGCRLCHEQLGQVCLWSFPGTSDDHVGKPHETTHFGGSIYGQRQLTALLFTSFATIIDQFSSHHWPILALSNQLIKHHHYEPFMTSLSTSWLISFIAASSAARFAAASWVGNTWRPTRRWRVAGDEVKKWFMRMNWAATVDHA